ncbi:MAG: flippase [Candidatus Sumerlaeota bacterium]|nr:flippase [Candidatus Sumerlaeota bacterium]
MSRVRIHFKNTASLLIAGATSKLFIFLATVQIFKALSIDDNGKFQFAYTFGFVFAILTEFGLRGYVMREMSRLSDDLSSAQSLFSNTVVLRFLLLVPVIPLSLILLHVLGYSHELVVLSGCFLIYAFLDSFAMIMKYILRSFERMEYDALLSFLGRGIILILIFLFAMSGRINLATIALSHLTGAMLETIGLLITIRVVTGLRPFGRFRISNLKNLLICSLPFAILNLVGILYLRTGTFALSKYLGNEAVACFNTASKLPEAFNFLPLAFVNALIPFLSQNYDNIPTIRRYFNFQVRYLGFIGIFMAVIFLIETRFIIICIAKADYLVATPTFQCFGLWILFTFIQYITANILICLNEERVVMRQYMMALIINVTLNILLIPRWGITGAAWALLISECASTTFNLMMLKNRTISIPWNTILQIAIIGSSTALTLLLMRNQVVFVRIPTACVVAGGITLFVAWKEDRQIIINLIRRTKL